jgi:class 3 adenylate cyclase/CheY-like chemotaxis protein
MESGPALSDYLNLSSRTSSFVSIDVVGSTALKTGENEQDIIYSFLAYHKLVSQLTYDHHGEVFHITGDGIMCRFQRPGDAAGLAQAILRELVTFNKKQNRLRRPVSLRIGVHTGEVTESNALSPGQLISHTIDVTAKVQRGAPPDHARFSEATLSELKDKNAYHRIGWDAALGMNIFEYTDTSAARASKRDLPNPARILILEQELDEIIRLKKTLGSERYDALAVYTQNQAALCMTSWRPHLIILSMDLPWETGWELLTMLRADASFSSIPMISMSRQTTGEIIQKCFKMGANGFLQKPLDPQQILKRSEMVMREFYL